MEFLEDIPLIFKYVIYYMYFEKGSYMNKDVNFRSITRGSKFMTMSRPWELLAFGRWDAGAGGGCGGFTQRKLPRPFFFFFLGGAVGGCGLVLVRIRLLWLLWLLAAVNDHGHGGKLDFLHSVHFQNAKEGPLLPRPMRLPLLICQSFNRAPISRDPPTSTSEKHIRHPEIQLATIERISCFKSPKEVPPIPNLISLTAFKLHGNLLEVVIPFWWILPSSLAQHLRWVWFFWHVCSGTVQSITGKWGSYASRFVSGSSLSALDRWFCGRSKQENLLGSKEEARTPLSSKSRYENPKSPLFVSFKP